MLRNLRRHRVSSMYAMWFPLIIGWLVLSAGCGAVPDTASIESPAATVASAAQQLPGAASGAGLLDKSQGPLSPLLAQLAQPEVAAQSVQQQAEALALPASGPGSLLRNEQGQVLVAVRVGEASAATEEAMRALGATIVNSAPAFNTITLYISPEQLQALAALPGVENVREEVRPS